MIQYAIQVYATISGKRRPIREYTFETVEQLTECSTALGELVDGKEVFGGYIVVLRCPDGVIVLLNNADLSADGIMQTMCSYYRYSDFMYVSFSTEYLPEVMIHCDEYIVDPEQALIDVEKRYQKEIGDARYLSLYRGTEELLKVVSSRRNAERLNVQYTYLTDLLNGLLLCNVDDKVLLYMARYIILHWFNILCIQQEAKATKTECLVHSVDVDDAGVTQMQLLYESLCDVSIGSVSDEAMIRQFYNTYARDILEKTIIPDETCCYSLLASFIDKVNAAFIRKDAREGK